MVGSPNNPDAWGTVSPDERARTTESELAAVTDRIWLGGRRLEIGALTGAARYRFDFPVTEGRDNFGPDLTLEYDSSYGNSAFGWGWRLPVTFIGRRTEPEMPRYGEGDDDSFVFGADELVPAVRNTGEWVDDRFTVGEYLVQRYRRRIEGRYDRIERWQHQPSSQTHWRVTDANNVTSLFGSTDEARESDPASSTKTVRWLLTERFDDRGNIVRYGYKRENLDNVDVESGLERHRKDKPDARGGTRYLKRIQYGNVAPHDRSDWHYEVVFDYGDHDAELPTPTEAQGWAVRPDPFSDSRAGFERRVWRRCQRVLMFHKFKELGETPVLVGATSLGFEDEPGRSLLARLQHTGYIVHPDGAVQTRSAPPVEFGYQRPDFDDTVHSLDSDVIVGALLDERSGARWIDLHDEALPGLAMRVGGSWCFVRNYGGGHFGEPEVVADTFRLDPDDTELIDLTGEEPFPAHERQYQPTTTMRATANLNQDDPYVGYIDLNGDNADDVVVADERLIRWYPSQGEAGFGDPVVLNIDVGGPVRPACLHADDRQSLWVADMSGDGLYDLVRIRSGEVSYWPHRGRGRFGDRIVMNSSPAMPANDAGAGRLLLGDLTATGSADLIWVDNGEVRYWENFSGASFGNPRRASAPGIVPGALGVTAVDVFGRGADCIVWIDQTSGTPSLRYISPVGNKRPHLLCSVKNGRGGETRCTYVSTAELRSRDREAGRDQLTSLGVPVQVVERIEHRDNVSQTRDLTRYVFRHGAFDDETRQFIGFAYKEEWRSGSQQDYAEPGLFAHEPAIGNDSNKRAVPTLRKTWTHTGVMFEGEDLAFELVMEYFADPQTHKRSWLSGNQVAEQERTRDNVDSYAALRGRLIREEFYDVAKGTASVPLTVNENTSAVRQVQPARNGKSGSYDAVELENVHVFYDTEGNDPRISHDIVFDVDAYGLHLKTAHVNYGRRQPADPTQGVTHLRIEERVYSNRSDQATWYRVGVPRNQVTWNASGILPAVGDLYEPDEVSQQFNALDVVTPGEPASGSYRQITARKRFVYWSNDLARLLDGDELESKALLARVDQLALSDATVRRMFDERDVADILRYEGGYEHQDGLWWAPGVTTIYSPTNFYLAMQRRDALGRQTTLRYAHSGLAVSETEDGFGNRARYIYHPRTNQAWQTVDLNNNVVANRFDPLGNLLSSAVMGKPGRDRGDSLLLTAAEASGRDDPTLVVTYAAFDSETQTPSFVRVRHRTDHQGNKANLVDSFAYFDSEGRVLARSERSDDSPWLVSNYAVLDSDGNQVAVALPFLSDTPWPDVDRANEALGDCHAYRFDALGRITRIDQPGGTYVATTYEPWTVVEADANDKILDTSWYADRHGASQGRAADFAARAMQQYEARAAAIAAVHANTPVHNLLDANGNVVLVRRTVSNQETVTHRYGYDQRGDLITVSDSRALTVKRTSRDLIGRTVRVDHSDAGVTQRLLASSGEVLRHWDPLGRCTRYRYDANGNHTHSYFNSGVGAETLIERLLWGGGDTSIPEAEARNLVGVAHMKLSSAGLVTVEECDWNGNETKVSLRAAAIYDRASDWMSVDAVINSGQLLQILTEGDTPLLETKAWITDKTYDAIGRVRRRSGKGIGTLKYSYGAHKRLGHLQLLLEGGAESVLLEEIRYDSSGRPSLLRYGNGSWIRRHYNAAGRLSHIAAASRGIDQPLQDLSIAYDPNGNVTIIGEGAELAAAFTYDGINRLVKAEGRQKADDSTGEGGHYGDSYALDSEGNTLEFRHKSGSIDRAIAYDYQSGGNQLRALTVQEPSAEPFNATYQYDSGGNLIHAPERRSYRWDQTNHLSRLELSDGTVMHFGYSLEGELIRRVIVEGDGKGVRDELTFDGFQRVRSLGDTTQERAQYVFVRMGEVPVARVAKEDDHAATVSFQLVDHVNSAVMELNESGKVIESRDYSAFGRMTHADKVDLPRFGFAGSVAQPDSPLYYCNRRWYDPSLGRYIQPSSWRDNSSNAYLFRNANPQRR